MKKFIALMISLCMIWAIFACPVSASAYFGVSHSLTSGSKRQEKMTIKNYQAYDMYVNKATVKIFINGVENEAKSISNRWIRVGASSISINTSKKLNVNWGYYYYKLNFSGVYYSASGNDY